MAIEPKPLGKYYGVVLRSPDHSHGHVFATGAVGASSSYPVVDFGELCVCCNKETRARQSLNPSSDRFKVAPVDVPVCDACTDHALNDNSSSIMMAALMMVGFGLGLWGAMESIWPLAGIGAFVAGLGALMAWLRHRARLTDTVDGHHPGLEHTATPRQCLVRTTNRTLAQALADRHAPLVHRAK